MTADEIIEQLNLVPLPEEGGFFKETYRDQGTLASSSIPHLAKEHSYSTCIYYLITPEEFSGLHAVKSTEIFHFYCGDPVEMVQIDQDGQQKSIIMGPDLLNNQSPQVVVPPLTWQGTKLVAGGSWALLGCTVAPGFDYSDFINGTFTELCDLFPQHRDIIKDFTHQ